MGFVKQVHKYFGATAKRTAEPLSLSLGKAALARGAGWERPAEASTRAELGGLCSQGAASLLSALPRLEKPLSLLGALVYVLL